MTDLQKSQIIALREQGYGYATIATSLGLTKNQVSAFCRRNSSSFTISRRMSMKFCSDACRTHWWNSHLDKVNRKAFYSFTCAHCGGPFTAYGNDHRKYCSHDCYIADRFGGDYHD